MKKRTYGVVSVIVLLAILLMVILSLAQQNSRREGDFQTMIDGLLESGQLVMFVLDTPLSTGETIITTDDAIVQVGDDYVCFGEPWNDDMRQRCTPFSNIGGVTFIEALAP